MGIVGHPVSPVDTMTAPILAGALNWVLKDFIGQLGGVWYASHLGKMRLIDAQPKKFRMLSSISLDAANGLEILSPWVPSICVLPVASVANLLKNISFLTASASRAALNQALTRQNNLADVTAKAGSQTMVASLVGTAAGIGLSSLLSHDPFHFGVAFIALSAAHQYGNYTSLRHVPLNHLDMPRLWLILEHYLKQDHVLTPVEVAREENFLAHYRVPGLSIGRGVSHADFEDEAQDPDCLYWIRRHAHDGTIDVTFLQGAQGSDLLQGAFHAACLLHHQNFDSSRFDDWLTRLQAHGWNVDTDVTRIEPRGAVRIKVLR
jgi:hypothetical protein